MWQWVLAVNVSAAIFRFPFFFPAKRKFRFFTTGLLIWCISKLEDSKNYCYFGFCLRWPHREKGPIKVWGSRTPGMWMRTKCQGRYKVRSPWRNLSPKKFFPHPPGSISPPGEHPNRYPHGVGHRDLFCRSSQTTRGAPLILPKFPPPGEISHFKLSLLPRNLAEKYTSP